MSRVAAGLAVRVMAVSFAAPLTEGPPSGLPFLSAALAARARERQARAMKWLLALAALMLFPAAALADPCEGRLPSQQGETFSGQVRYVGDGDSICIGPSADPATRMEVRLPDFDAPELNRPGGRESRTVGGRVPACAAVRGRSGRVIVYDRAIAACRLNGRGLGDLLRAAGGWEGGR